MSTTNSRALNLVRRAKTILYLILVLVIAPTYLYFNLPVINPWFIGLPMEVLIISLTIAMLEIQVLKGQRSTVFMIAASIAAISLIYMLSMGIVGLPIFRANAYHQLLGEVKEGESFSKDIAAISVDKIRIVDEDVAHRLGDKVLGQEVGLGSQVYVGEYHIQKVKDELYWVAPLEHSGFFKWMNNRSGTHGYIKVSATNERDVELVREVNGNPVRIKYQMGGFFGDYLPRHIYFSGYLTLGMTDYTFEIDDEGNPYWVVTLYRHAIGFGGNVAYGIVVVNATTGDVTKYSPDDAPAWVDRIQPKEFVEDQINHWGEYVHGFWNFSNKDKLMATNGISLVYGHDNRSYYYTGITSVGADESTIGFMLVDTRTKETVLYRQPGATEAAAQSSAMGKVQEKGYISSFPIMYNINGIATYVMSLKDQAGLIKMIAMVSVEDYSIVGVGDELKDALRNYKDAYNSSGNNPIVTPSTNSKSVAGRITRISEDISGGNSYYYMMIEGVETKIFIGSSSVSRKLPLTAVGDSVKLIYDDGKKEEIDLTGFENFFIQTKATETKEIK